MGGGTRRWCLCRWYPWVVVGWCLRRMISSTNLRYLESSRFSVIWAIRMRPRWVLAVSVIWAIRMRCQTRYQVVWRVGMDKNEHKRWAIWRNEQRVERVINGKWQVIKLANAQIKNCMCVWFVVCSLRFCWSENRPAFSPLFIPPRPPGRHPQGHRPGDPSSVSATIVARDHHVFSLFWK